MSETVEVELRSPYPWFGGKRAVAPIVWERFGDVQNYVEPFLGSAAMLLARPHWPWEGNRIETVNDADCFVANFWRALQADPEAVAFHADWPVNEKDLRDRHDWLVNSDEIREWRAKMAENGRVHDPHFFDARIAGWWVWGCCQWIGSGWCHHPEWQQLPHLGSAGMGVHRPSQQLPHLGNAGMGVHRPSQQLPHLGNAGRGEPEIYDYMRLLAERFKRVRVCCGDWSRFCGPTPTVKQGITGVFLDPPYAAEADRKGGLYAIDDLSISHQVRAWCLEWGNDKRMRICLAGYAGEGHEELERHGWEVVQWKARGGYGSQGDGSTNGRDNAAKERLWFSPHCESVEMGGLFAGIEDA